MPISLGYGREHLLHRLLRQFRRRHLVHFVLLVAFAYVMNFHHRWLTDPVMLAYRQSRVSDGTQSLLVCWTVRDRYHLGGQYLESLAPASWQSFINAGLPIDETPVYLGEISHPSGPRRLIAITLARQVAPASATLVSLRAWVFEPGTMTSLPRRIWKGQPVALINQRYEKVQIFAGAASKRLPNEFEIEYGMEGISNLIQGRLEADETVSLATLVPLPPVAVARPKRVFAVPPSPIQTLGQAGITAYAVDNDGKKIAGSETPVQLLDIRPNFESAAPNLVPEQPDIAPARPTAQGPSLPINSPGDYGRWLEMHSSVGTLDSGAVQLDCYPYNVMRRSSSPPPDSVAEEDGPLRVELDFSKINLPGKPPATKP